MRRKIYQITDVLQLPNEIWKTIPNLENRYQISNYGRVKSLNYKNKNIEGILEQFPNKYGYLYTTFPQNGKTINKPIHRLVAQSFLDDYSDDMEVNHISEDKTNNCVSNLEMCTHVYNMRYGERGEKVSKKLINGYKSKKVGKYTLEGKLIKAYPSIHQVERESKYTLSSSTISACCRNKYNGNSNIYKGYKWQYIKKEDS